MRYGQSMIILIISTSAIFIPTGCVERCESVNIDISLDMLSVDAENNEYVFMVSIVPSNNYTIRYNRTIMERFSIFSWNNDFTYTPSIVDENIRNANQEIHIEVGSAYVFNFTMKLSEDRRLLIIDGFAQAELSGDEVVEFAVIYSNDDSSLCSDKSYISNHISFQLSDVGGL
ncbi:MAG: hypothetical protein KIS81_11545 [Maricaulaceae bacterium]|nr:hypothetical protein [Maricaulaceae bacterium]